MRPFPTFVSWCVAGAVLCLAGDAGAQQGATTHEAALWMETGFRHEPVRRLRLSVDQMFRVDENISRPAALINELSLRYSPLRWLRLGVGYRLAFKLDSDNELRLRHRMQIDVATRHRFRWLQLGLRLRFQEEARSEADEGEPWRHVFRFRMGVQMRRIPVVDPFVSFEVFVRIADDNEPLSTRKLRGTAGFGIDVADATFELGYRIEGDLDDDAILHIILLSCHFDID